ncbi:ABC transporter ATP-binding protein [Spirochaetia bacterium]|nr:ABC transporter ATP-binding protein [Spirochaetia bacterium]
MEKPLVEIKFLKKYFPVSGPSLRKNSYVKAVNDVSFSIGQGETLGLVGESGCGKSTLGRTIVGLYQPDSGQILFEGTEISALARKKMNLYRKNIQMIFQDPYSSLNPRFTVGDIIEEPLIVHKMYTPKERTEIVRDILALIGLKPDHVRRYPHEFSGGQRQRIGIARTLVLNPKFIVCDEPISALDVSIQAQIVNLLEKIQQERGISYLFIAHDLGMVRHVSHKVAVMYLGRLVEYGPTDEVYKDPWHPYTQALLSAAPIPDPISARNSKRILLEGEIPNPIDIPDICPFAGRCRYVNIECSNFMPKMVESGQRKVACFLYYNKFRKRNSEDKDKLFSQIKEEEPK